MHNSCNQYGTVVLYYYIGVPIADYIVLYLYTIGANKIIIIIIYNI